MHTFGVNPFASFFITHGLKGIIMRHPCLVFSRHWPLLVVLCTALSTACSKPDSQTAISPVAQVGLAASPLAKPTLVPNHTVNSHNTVWVAQNQGPLSLLDLEQQNWVGEWPISGRVADMDADPEHKRLVLSYSNINTLSWLSTDNPEQENNIGIGVKAQTVRLFGQLVAASTNDGKLLLVNLESGVVEQQLPMGSNAGGMAWFDDGKHLAVTLPAKHRIHIYNMQNGSLKKAIDVRNQGLRPTDIARSPDGKHFAVVLSFGNRVVLFDEDFNMLHDAPTGEVPVKVQFDHGGERLVVSLLRGKMLQVFNANTLELQRELPQNEPCLSFDFSPENQEMVLLCERSQTLHVINLETGQQRFSAHRLGGAHRLRIMPAKPL
jgi:DNA-binding beta-propeller fold protein YncE